MAKKKITFGSLELLQFITGVALFLIGLLAIVNYNSTGRQFQRFVTEITGGKSDTVDLILGIILAVSGVLVTVTTVVTLDRTALLIAAIVSLVVWGVRIILVYFAGDVAEPNFLVWAVPLAKDLIILAALWIVCRRYLR
jgi:hypothetical protein